MATAANVCARCGGEATKRCTGCIEGVDDEGNAAPTFYCTNACQKADWKTHKHVCQLANRKKQLFRGASLAQDIFYVFRENTFDGSPQKITSENGQLRLEIKRNVVGPHIMPIYPFPHQLFESEEDKKAVLSWLTCNESMCCMHELLKKVLKGITDIPTTELGYSVPESRAYIYDVDENGHHEPGRFTHWVLNVCLKGGYQYVIDLAGAQYQQYQPVLPLMPYLAKYVPECPSERKFGYHDEYARAECNDPKAYDCSGPHHYRLQIMLGLTEEVNGTIAKCEKDHGKTIAEMLNLKQDEFECERNSILKNVKVQMQDYVKRLKIRFQEIHEEIEREKAASTDVGAGASAVDEVAEDVIKLAL